jgi:hypothetical protein
MGPCRVKSRALVKYGEHNSSNLHFRMRKKNAAPRGTIAEKNFSAPLASVRLFTQPGSLASILTCQRHVRLDRRSGDIVAGRGPSRLTDHLIMRAPLPCELRHTFPATNDATIGVFFGFWGAWLLLWGARPVNERMRNPHCEQMAA